MPGLWRGEAPLLLASTSPTRRALLAAAAIPHDTEAPGVDERALEAELGRPDPARLAAALAGAKALAVSRRHPARLVLGADQVLDLDGAVFCKAENRDEAHAQLARLAGRSHRLHAAFALARAGGIVAAGAGTATLTLRPLGEAAIASYLAAAGEAPMRSVGGYEIEGLGLHLMERVEGEHTTILGLPMLPLLAALRDLGALAP
ncbi:MAG: Maf family protein [Methylobacteriaceae bacterium]|nr:Maf family protein [Methylobacteriaceae bacterium]